MPRFCQITLLATVLGMLPAGSGLAQRARPSASRPPSVRVSPERVDLRLGEGANLRALLRNYDGRVLWRVEGAACGSVSPTGYYQSPSVAQTPATVRVSAVLEDDPAVRAETVVFISAVSVAIKNPSLVMATSQSGRFQAEVVGTGDQRVTWSVEGGPQNGLITGTGLYTAPATFLTPGTVTVRATSVADPSKSATASVRLSPISLQIKPLEATVQHGRAQKFDVKVLGTPNQEIEWAVLGDGEISPTGIYSTPAVMATPAVVTVVAKSKADPSKTASARIRVEAIGVHAGGNRGDRGIRRGPLPTTTRLIRTAIRRVTRLYLPFNPLDAIVPGPVFRGKSGKQYVPLGGALPLAAAVSGTTNDRVKWQLEGNSVGEISEDGYYQSPSALTTPQVVQVRATSLADPSKSHLHTLHIPPVVVEAPKSVAVCPLDGAVQLQARVENSEDDTIRWSVDGGESMGVVSSTGLYRPPTILTTPATIRVRATSQADPSKSATIEIQIPELKLELITDTVEVRPGESVRLKARVKGCLTAGDILWRLTPEIGSISGDGLYHAPADSRSQVVQVAAVLKPDPTKVAIATIRIRRK